MRSARTVLARVTMLVTSMAVGAAGGSARSAEVVELGGPRKVTVRVEDRGVEYAVTATMLPVGAFDEATNALLNRSKAEQYALGGLTKFLANGSAAASRAYSGVTAENIGLVDGRYALTLVVPKKGVGPPQSPPTGGKKEAPKPPATSVGDAERAAADGGATSDTSGERSRSGTWPGKALFTVIDDYSATIDTVAEEMQNQIARISAGWEQAAGDLSLAAEKPLAEIESCVEVRRGGIGKCDAELDAVVERAGAAFQRIQAEYAKDLKVMSLEREALNETLRAKESEFAGKVQALRDHLARAVAEMDSLLEARRKKGEQPQ